MSEWVQKIDQGARAAAAMVTQARIVSMLRRELGLFVKGGTGREIGFAPPSQGELDACREILVNGYNAGLHDAGNLIRERLDVSKVRGLDRLLEDLVVMRVPARVEGAGQNGGQER